MKAPPTVKELIAELYERFPEFFEPKPCLTCEALARTVMLDQTSHDRHKREWVELSVTDIDNITHKAISIVDAMLLTEETLKELNK